MNKQINVGNIFRCKHASSMFLGKKQNSNAIILINLNDNILLLDIYNDFNESTIYICYNLTQHNIMSNGLRSKSFLTTFQFYFEPIL